LTVIKSVIIADDKQAYVSVPAYNVSFTGASNT